jgi:hypothetical protein
MFATCRRVPLSRLLLALGLAACGVAPAPADLPTTPDARAKVIGQPTGVIVQPDKIALKGPRATQQIVISGRYADGTLRDLTHVADVTIESGDIAGLDTDRFLSAHKNGTTNLVVKAGTHTVKVPVIVTDADRPQPISFRNEVIAALNVGGCNQGACHGTPSGKNGFKLSLRGYDPAADYIQLTHDVLGRRTDRQNPLMSLMLQKGLGRVPHEGGARFALTSIPAQTILGWLREGLSDDPAKLATVKDIEVLPGNRVLNDPARYQQLAVLAHFTDGSVRDVTRLSVFSSSDPAIANVNANGLVEFAQAGEVAILCRYLEVLEPECLTFLEPKLVHRSGVHPPGIHGRVRRVADAGGDAAVPRQQGRTEAHQAGR